MENGISGLMNVCDKGENETRELKSERDKMGKGTSKLFDGSKVKQGKK
jgi:hypothetical protein